MTKNEINNKLFEISDEIEKIWEDLRKFPKWLEELSKENPNNEVMALYSTIQSLYLVKEEYEIISNIMGKLKLKEVTENTVIRIFPKLELIEEDLCA